jgi:nucleotide-binding universal stress UspA family protein
MKRILVPCDFSESAIQAYIFALNLAAQTQAEVYVLKVIDMPFVYEVPIGVAQYYVDSNILKQAEDQARKNFEKLKGEHTKQEGVTFTTIVGPVTITIRQFILEQGIDLVVMGTLGASGWKEYFVGSNTEKVVRFSPVPVLAVRKAQVLSRIKNIVFPTTLEFDQVDLVYRIKDLQSHFSAMLHLLLINTPGNMKRTKDEMEMMEEYAHYYKLKDYSLNTRNDFYEQDGIINFAHEIKADMIAMGTHARKGLAHLFMGSVTEDVVNHVDCPIWTYSVRK